MIAVFKNLIDVVLRGGPGSVKLVFEFSDPRGLFHDCLVICSMICNTNEKCWPEFNSKAISFVYASSTTEISCPRTLLRMYSG